MLGHSELPEEFDQDRAFRHADALICTLQAGPIAQSIYSRKATTRGCGGKYDQADIQCICRFLLSMSPSVTRERTARGLAIATRAILQTPGIWEQLTAIAEALLARNVLTWDECRALMDDSGLNSAQRAIACNGRRDVWQL